MALSSTEAEYVALTQASKEAMWLRRLLEELKVLDGGGATLIHEDNQSAIALANNPIYHARTKHIDIKHHFVRELVDSGIIDVVHTPTEVMIADILTKPLPKIRFDNLTRAMNLRGSGIDPRSACGARRAKREASAQD